MYPSRRSLLQAGLLAAVAPLAWGRQPDELLRLYVLEAGQTGGLFRPGDSLLVDTSRQAFSAAGIYLYPDWGQPRPYHVQRNGEWLEFRIAPDAPPSWRQRTSASPGFAGLVLGTPGAQQVAVPPLRVPRLPVIG